jgi:hypothetical protein
MPLTHIEYGSLASSDVMNDNFEYLDNRATTIANNLSQTASGINSTIASMNSTFTQKNEELQEDISDLSSDLADLRNDFESKDITPDYAKAVTVYNSSGSGTFNINWDGWLEFDLYCRQNSAAYQFYIDNIMVGATASDENDRASNIVLVKSGSTATWNGSQSIVIKKVPFVGG